MSDDTAKDHLLLHLKEAHALEQTSLRMTQAATKATDDPQLRELFEHHHEETEEHERLIRERLEAHEESPSKLKDVGARFAAVGKGATAVVGSDTPGRLARDGYVQEHAEIAAYELLCRVAEKAEDGETLEVARRILENERQTAEKFERIWDHAVGLSLAQASASV